MSRHVSPLACWLMTIVSGVAALACSSSSSSGEDGAGAGGSGAGGGSGAAMSGGTGGAPATGGSGGEAGSAGGSLDCQAFDNEADCNSAPTDPETSDGCSWQEVYTAPVASCDLGEPTPTCVPVKNIGNGLECSGCNGGSDLWIYKLEPNEMVSFIYIEVCTSEPIGFTTVGWTYCGGSESPAFCGCWCPAPE